MECAKIICDAAAVLFSLAAVIISVISLCVTKGKNKNDTLLIVRGFINNARSNLSKVSLEISNNTALSAAVQKKIFEEAKEQLLNAYELSCERFFKKEIDKTDFYDNFADDIKAFFENADYAEKYFSGKVSSFYYIPKYYKEYIAIKKSSKR